MNDLISYAEAASLLGLPQGTLRSLVSKRRVPHVRLSERLVRFRIADLERWLEANSVKPVVEPTGADAA